MIHTTTDRARRYVLLAVMALLPLCAVAQPPLIERFDSLDDWKPLTFPKIAAHSTYTRVTEGSNSVLRAASNASASGLMRTSTFDVTQHPTLSWRWKIDNVIAKGNARSKKGDDYPVRIYVTFAYDPDTAGFGFKRRTQYGLAKKLYGENPPAQCAELYLGQPHTDRPHHPERLF